MEPHFPKKFNPPTPANWIWEKCECHWHQWFTFPGDGVLAKASCRTSKIMVATNGQKRRHSFVGNILGVHAPQGRDLIGGEHWNNMLPLMGVTHLLQGEMQLLTTKCTHTLKHFEDRMSDSSTMTKTTAVNTASQSLCHHQNESS